MASADRLRDLLTVTPAHARHPFLVGLFQVDDHGRRLLDDRAETFGRARVQERVHPDEQGDVPSRREQPEPCFERPADEALVC